MNKEINISILSDVIANKIIDACNLNVNKQKIIANIISEALDEYTIQRNVTTSTEIEIQIILYIILGKREKYIFHL